MTDTAANSATAPSNTANNANLLPTFSPLATDASETYKFIFNVVPHKRIRHRLKATPFIKPTKLTHFKKPMKLRHSRRRKKRRLLKNSDLGGYDGIILISTWYRPSTVLPFARLAGMAGSMATCAPMSMHWPGFMVPRFAVSYTV